MRCDEQQQHLYCCKNPFILPLWIEICNYKCPCMQCECAAALMCFCEWVSKWALQCQVSPHCPTLPKVPTYVMFVTLFPKTLQHEPNSKWAHFSDFLVSTFLTFHTYRCKVICTYLHSLFYLNFTLWPNFLGNVVLDLDFLTLLLAWEETGEVVSNQWLLIDRQESTVAFVAETQSSSTQMRQ